MMLQWLMLLTLFVHNSVAFRLYDDIDTDCQKDILIMVDSSNSVGETYFENIRNFLLKLVDKLNVREGGTELGFITFSNKERTKKLLDVGNKTDPTELKEWLENLNYKAQLMGGYTRTGLAFEIANNMFSQTSPLNNRETVEDVILLFTDGEPYAGSTKKDEKEKELIVTNTNKLKKEKNVKIIGVAAGTPAQNNKFKKDIQSWVTKGTKVVETSLNKLTRDEDVDEIVNKLISPLCNKEPVRVDCSCTKDIEPFKVYVKKGEITTQVVWPVPITCTGDASYTVDPPNANAKSGDRFGLGEHVITYSSSYINDVGKNVDRKCPVQFTVVACECPSIQTVQAQNLPGANKKSYASWTKPAPNCPAQPNPSRAHSGWFYAGETTVTHKYRVANKFDLECPVKIVVPGEFCGNTAYDPATQVCCCGNVSSKKTDKHRCCGQNYINPGNKMCCQGNKPVRLPGPCGP